MLEWFYVFPTLAVFAGYVFFLEFGWMSIIGHKYQRALLFYAITQALIAIITIFAYLILVITSVIFILMQETPIFDNYMEFLLINGLFVLINMNLGGLSGIFAYDLYIKRKQYCGLKTNGVYVVNSYTNAVEKLPFGQSENLPYL